jgi:hypothetical protein
MSIDSLAKARLRLIPGDGEPAVPALPAPEAVATSA